MIVYGPKQETKDSKGIIPMRKEKSVDSFQCEEECNSTEIQRPTATAHKDFVRG